MRLPGVDDEEGERVHATLPAVVDAHVHLFPDGLFEAIWLDTTMALAGYFDVSEPAFRMVEARPDRIMYGTDFPNIPYAWDRELELIRARGLADSTLASVLGDTARAFYRIDVH